MSRVTSRHCWVVDVDSSPYASLDHAARDHMLAAAVKQIPAQEYTAIREAIRTGAPRETWPHLDLACGGVSLVDPGGHLRRFEAQLEEIRQQIIEGRIRVEPPD